MRSKLWMILIAAALLLSAPLAAQLPDDPDQSPDATVEDVDRELDGDAEIEFDTEADVDAEAEVSFDDDAALDEERELPRTASPLPLLALLGAGSLASALGVRISRRK